jgi:hypothetical protein
VAAVDVEKPDLNRQLPDILARQGQQIAEAVQTHWSVRPAAGLILGTGLGPLGSADRSPRTFDYADLPHLPRIDGTQPSRPIGLRQLERRPDRRHGRALPFLRRLLAPAIDAAGRGHGSDGNRNAGAVQCQRRLESPFRIRRRDGHRRSHQPDVLADGDRFARAVPRVQGPLPIYDPP